MTAKQIFEMGAALIQEKVGEDPDTSYFTPYFLTIALAEALDAENAYRKANDMDPLWMLDQVQSLDDDIPFVNPALTLRGLPYALASHYYRDNNDTYHEQLFRSEFVSAVNEGTPFEIGTIKDVY